MHIQVIGALQVDQRSFEHIIKLFFEEVNVAFSEESEAGVKIFLSQQESDLSFISVELQDVKNNQVIQRQVQADLSNISSPEEERKRIKRSLSQALLYVLEEYTGIVQPWGILTGVRPTKLYHQKYRQGYRTEEIHHVLKEEYLITEEKISLMEQIVTRQLHAVPDLYKLSTDVSIYIGIPFCPTKCAYCTFPAYSIQGRQGSVESFLGGLHYEIQVIGQWLKDNKIKVTTVYFGGGTPTSITAEEMDLLYEEMYRSIPMDAVREVTVEAGRPDTITPEKLAVLNKWNIDRISINPQSYTQATLDAIGRHHTVDETIKKFMLAREMGMNNINMDLIIGLPGEGTEEFEHTLKQTEALLPESLTVHTLSFKRASEMTQNKDKYRVAGREEINHMMRLASDWTKKNGYDPYYLYRQKNILGNLENVGYSFPEQESIYNIMIMEEMQTIIGLGCGAASKWVNPISGEISRFANPKEPRAYNENFESYTKAKIDALNDLFLPASIS